MLTFLFIFVSFRFLNANILHLKIKENPMLKKMFILFALIVSLTSYSTFAQVKVVVSFNAMREFTEAVGGNLVEIKTIIPDGVEPHDYEPKASDMINLNNSRIFIFNGYGMETWVGKSLKALNNKNLVAVEAAKGFAPIKNTDPDAIKEHGQYDPHVWLSLKGAENASKNIKEALISADPVNKSKYEKNYNVFIGQLESLFNEYKKKFDSIRNRNFVTGHAAFAYLSRDFGLNQNSIEDVFAEGEPSAKKMAELIDYCKKNGIKTVFVEDLVSPKISETLAKEVGAKAVQIYTVESKEEGMNYIQCMKANLEMIYQSMM
jgi:zinc transport system substrate-binding protein